MEKDKIHEVKKKKKTNSINKCLCRIWVRSYILRLLPSRCSAVSLRTGGDSRFTRTHELEVPPGHSPRVSSLSGEPWDIKEGCYGLANVAPTVVKMMGLTAPGCWEASMV